MAPFWVTEFAWRGGAGILPVILGRILAVILQRDLADGWPRATSTVTGKMPALLRDIIGS